MVAEAPKFAGKFFKKKCLGIYNAIVRANRVRFTALRAPAVYRSRGGP